MDNPDVFFQILARVDHETLLKLCHTQLLVLASQVIKNWTFWKLRAEFAIGKSLSERREADWRHIYSVLRLGAVVYVHELSHLPHPVCSVTRLAYIYEYTLDNLTTMEAVVEAYGPPDWGRTYPCFIWTQVTSTEVLRYLIEVHNLPLAEAGSGLITAVDNNRVEMVKFLLPLVSDAYSLEGAAGHAENLERIEVLQALLPSLSLKYKKNLLNKSIKNGRVSSARLLIDAGVTKPNLAMLKKAINRGHEEMTLYLLTLINPTKKSELLLALASRRGSSMFRLVLGDERIDPTSYAATVLDSIAEWSAEDMAALLQDRKLVVRELSSLHLAILMRGALMIDECRTDALKYWKKEEETEDNGVCEELFLFLMNRVRTPKQVLQWITERKDNTLVASALSSLKNDTLPEVKEAEPLRALMLALVYPSMIVEDHLLHLREEKTSSKNLLLSARLLTAYLP